MTSYDVRGELGHIETSTSSQSSESCVSFPLFPHGPFPTENFVEKGAKLPQASKNFAEDVAILIWDLAKLSAQSGGGGGGAGHYWSFEHYIAQISQTLNVWSNIYLQNGVV